MDRTERFYRIDQLLQSGQVRSFAALKESLGVSRATLDALLDFGRVVHVDRGRDIVFFDKKARARLAKADTKVVREAARLCRTYAILGSDGTVVTVGHRYRRIPRI